MILIRQGSRSTSASCPTRSTSPRTSRGARERERGRQKEAWKRHFSLFDMKYERAVAKSKRQDLLCSRILGHIGFDVGNNQIFLFSLLEYGSEERPKNEDVEARKLGASNLLPFCCTNHQSLSNRTLVAPLRAAHWPVLQFSPDSVFVCYVDVRITTE